MKQMNSFFRMSSLAVAALAITASCSNEELDGVNGLSKANTFITATFEQPGGGINTRTTLGNNNEVLWQSGDQFKLFYDLSESAVFKTEETGATVNFGATISGDIESATYAIFPIMTDVDVTLSGTTATTTLRKEIPFSKATNGPMWADASTDYTNLSFKHLAGLLKLTVSGLPTDKELVLKVTADKNIAGTATVNLQPVSGEPYLEVSDAAGATGVEKEITVTGVQAVDGKATVFYVPLPVKTLGELKVNIYDKNDTSTPLYKEKKWTNIAVARAMIRSASFGFEVVDLNDSNAKTISQAIDNAVPSGDASSATTTTVEISGALNTDQNETNKTISVPSVGNKNVALVFADAPITSDENALTIQDAETGASQTDAVNTITLSLPATDQAVKNVVIDTPQSTFELTSSATETTQATKYTTITATTANNTLVVGDKVKIGTIKVKGGNVRLKKGSEVSTIDNQSGGTITVFKESDVTQPTKADGSQDVIFVDINQDANSDNVLALENILAKGGTYILPANITLTKPLVVSSKDATIDLNGFNITATSLTAPAGLTSDDALVIVRRGAKLTINDTKGTGSIDGTVCRGDHCAVKLTDSADESDANIKNETATLVVNGGTLKGVQAGISGNGNRHNTDITINGGCIMSTNVEDYLDGVGIYHPQSGTLTITGGTIEGYQSALELRSGTLKISGGTFTSRSTIFSESPNGNGTTLYGSALAVSQHTTNKDIAVTITGGTFNGIRALHEVDLQDEQCSNIAMTVEGGIFNGAIYSENCPNFIHGGEFSDVSALNYIADGGNVKLAKDLVPTVPIVVNKKATLDLNGYSIRPSGALGQVLNTKDAVVLVRRGANLTIKDSKGGGMIDGGVNNAAVKLTDTADGETGDLASLTVESGTLQAKYFAVVGNGSRHNTSVTINGGTLKATADGPAIYHPQEGTLNINGGTLEGGECAVELRSGTLNITDGTLTSRATSFSKAANGSGTTIVGAALGVSQHSTDKAINVTITGGTFNGIYAIYEEDLQNDNVGNIKMSVTGGTFNGRIYSENCGKFVDGGTYSNPTVLNHVTNITRITVVKLVNLGLPSGKQWTSCNLGADSPREFGEYYFWSTANTEIATMGEGYSIPTKADFEELIANTNNYFTTIDGVKGFLFEASNLNSIFLPAAASLCEGKEENSGWVINNEGTGSYWTKTPDEKDEGYYYFLEFSQAEEHPFFGDREGEDNKLTIRPIYK